MTEPKDISEELTTKPKLFAVAAWKQMPLMLTFFFCLGLIALKEQRKTITLGDVGFLFFVVLFFTLISGLLTGGGWFFAGDMKVVVSVSRNRIYIKAPKKRSYWFPLFSARLANCSWSESADGPLVEIKVPIYSLWIKRPTVSVWCGRTPVERELWVQMLEESGATKLRREHKL